MGLSGGALYGVPCKHAALPQASVPFQVAGALYEAAVAKFEAVLEAQPGSRAILRACAFALYDLARLQPDQASRAAGQLLEVGGSGVEALHARLAIDALGKECA